MPTTLASPTACPTCRRPCAADALTCDLCGTLLRRARDPMPAAAPAPAKAAAPAPGLATGRFGPPPVPHEAPAPAPAPRVLGLRVAWFALLAGVALAPVLTFTPMLQRMGWFLSSLFHETGHTAMAWIFGCPAFPAIRLDGHAVSVHGEPSAIFRGMVTAGLLGLAWLGRRHPVRLTLALAGAVVYPLLAFTGAREVLFLAGGHLGELAFSAWALHQAISGGFTESMAERVTHAAVGMYLAGHCAWLFGGLVWSASVRSWYAESGSLGLVNDLLRMSRGFGCDIAKVAIVMLILALLAPLSALVRVALAREESLPG